MSFTDFLFGGTAPPQTTSYSSTSANLPDWWSAYAQGLLSKTSAVAGEPYQKFTGPRVAGLTPDQNQGFDVVRASTGVADPNLTQAGNLFDTAAGTDSFAAAQPNLAAAGALNQVAAGQPYLDQAGQTFPQNVDAYMSPYMTNVTDRIAELGNRNLTEKILPTVQDQFIAAGQPGSARASEFSSRAIRDTANEIAGQQSAALQQGYGQAGQLFQADASRQGALASTAGQLTAGQQGVLSQLAQLTGQLTSDTAGRQITAGGKLADLGSLQQQTALKDAAALDAIGGTQQQQQQRNLDTAYSDFLEERNYPRENIALLNQALRGVNPPASTTSTGTAPATSMGSSPLAQIAGTGLSAAALANLLKKRGGRVQVPYRRGGPVRGALSYGR